MIMVDALCELSVLVCNSLVALFFILVPFSHSFHLSLSLCLSISHSNFRLPKRLKKIFNHMRVDLKGARSGDRNCCSDVNEDEHDGCDFSSRRVSTNGSQRRIGLNTKMYTLFIVRSETSGIEFRSNEFHLI